MSKQRDITLAALRYFQEALVACVDLSHLQDIVDPDAIDPKEIDALCESLNSDSIALMVKLEGGLVQSVSCDRQPLEGAKVVVLDYDTEGVDSNDLFSVRKQDGTTRLTFGQTFPLDIEAEVDVAETVDAVVAHERRIGREVAI